VSSVTRGGGGGGVSDYDDDGWEVDPLGRSRGEGGGGDGRGSEGSGVRQQGRSHGEGWQDAVGRQGAEDEMLGKRWQDEFVDDGAGEAAGTTERRSKGEVVWRASNTDLAAHCLAEDKDVSEREEGQVGGGDDSM